MTTAKMLLNELGIGANYKGFRRAALAVKLVQEDENWLCHVTELYSEVAKVENCTWYAVEHSIRTIIDCAWSRSGSRLSEIAGYKLSAPPSAAEFLAILYNYVARRQVALADVAE